MSFIKTFLKTDTYPLRRWIVKKDDKGLVKEVKCIFNPEEYSKTSSRPMYGDKKLKEILVKDKINRNEKTQ